MAVRKILPALLITQGEGRGWTWIFTSPCCSATQAYYLHNCLICGQIQSGSGLNMLDKGPMKSEQDARVRSAVSVPWRTEFLSIPEAMKLGSFNNTKQKDRALQMRVCQALKLPTKKRKTWSLTLGDGVENPLSNAKTPPEKLIAKHAATLNNSGATSNELATSDPPVLGPIWKTASIKQKDWQNTKKLEYKNKARKAAAALYTQERHFYS